MTLNDLRGRYAGTLIHKDGRWKSPFRGPKQFAAYLALPLVVVAEAFVFLPYEVAKRYD